MFGALGRWWSQPDHFYWLSALLASRGAQDQLRRGLAATLLAIAAMIAVTVSSPAGPAGPVGHAVAISVAALSVVMAVIWLRSAWPTPRKSAGFVVASTVGIAALCLVQADPLGGLLASTGFAVLAGYIAFLHTPKILTVNFLAAIVTTAILALRLANSGDTAMAIGAFGFVMVVNLAVPIACQTFVHLLGVDVLNSDIDPLTGMRNKDAFYRDAAAFIAARSRADDRFFVLTYVSLDNQELLAEGRKSTADRIHVNAAQVIRDMTRHNAVTAHYTGADFLVADSFSGPDATPLVERIRSAMVSNTRQSVSIGVASTPMTGLAECAPDDVLDELIAVADEVMREARRNGGNQARFVHYPALSDVDEHEDR